MFSKSLSLLCALCLAAIPSMSAAEGLDGISQGRPDTGGASYGDRNRGGRSGFYSFPRHRSVDDGSGGDLDRSLASRGSEGTSSPYRSTHGSAYYGRNYGAPYFGGGYYDGGTYYRERRDR